MLGFCDIQQKITVVVKKTKTNIIIKYNSMASSSVYQVRIHKAGKMENPRRTENQEFLNKVSTN